MRLNRLWSFVWSKVIAVKIRVKIMGIGVGLVLLLGVSVTFLVRRNFRATLIDQLVERGTAIASDVAGRSSGVIFSNDISLLHELIGETVGNNDDVRYIFILDRSRDFFAHTFERDFPIYLLGINREGRGDRKPSVEVLDTGEGMVFDIAVPIQGEQTGVIHIGMSDRRLEETVAAITRHLLIATGIASLVGVFAAYILTRVLTKPILELVKVTEAVGSGDFRPRAPIWADDEIGHLSAAFNAMTENLSSSREKLEYEERMRSQLLEKIISAQEDERKRVARELHDQTSQSLTSLILGLKTIGMATTHEETETRIAELRSLAAQTLEEVHTLALRLRPSILDDLGLTVALKRYAEDFSRQFNINVDYQTVGLYDGKRLPSQLEITFYRIVQEALINAAKHAEPENISILMEHRGGSVLVIVEDDGKGFNVAEVMNSHMEKKLGLFGMQERVSLVGGRFTLESNPGSGTTVFVEAPIIERNG